MKEITEEDIEIMGRQSKETLALWSCELNRWNWPKELPDEDKSHENKSYKSNGRRSQLRQYTEEKAGHRLVSRTWNKDMSDDEFNEFYEGVFEGDERAKARYEARLKSKYTQE